MIYARMGKIAVGEEAVAAEEREMEAAYKRMYEKLKEQIAHKKYPIGSLLPPEPELEKEFQVSRTTVRRAIELLVRDGYITVKQGFGTQVVSRKSMQNLNRLTSISEALERKGHEVGIRSCYIEPMPADEDKARLLAVPVGTPLVCIHRIRTADGAPVSIEENYIIASYVPGLEDEGNITRLYAFLKERYGINYTGSRDIISACSADFEEAQLLEVPCKTALMTVHRVCSIQNSPVELDIVRIVSSVYEYEVYFEAPKE